MDSPTLIKVTRMNSPPKLPAMNGRPITVAFLALVFLAAAFDAEAARRGLRIDFGDWTDGFTLGTVDCPGSSPGSPAVFWNGVEFNSGSTQGTYTVDEYCQQALEFDPDEPNNGHFNENSLFFDDDEGLADKVGPNDDPNPLNNVTANRYTFLDDDSFVDPPPMGYQWEYFFFPGNITLVRLNGEVPIGAGNDFLPYIDDGFEIIWEGAISGYDGEYWCFDNGLFVGTWDGEPAGSAPLAGCGFEMECHELFLSAVGGGDVPLTSPRNSPNCPLDHYMFGELITLTARPAPGFKLSEWVGTDADSNLSLVNEVTFQPPPPQPRAGGGGGEDIFVQVYYEDALICPDGTVEQTWLSENMEDGAAGWTHSAAVGSDTWALQDENFVSPLNAWNGQAVAAASDQRLVSPIVTIPENTPIARLSYYNKRNFIHDDTCNDGAILEYSTNGGADWVWFHYDDFERDHYNGFTEWPTGHPVPPEQNGWCGEGHWTLTEVDVTDLVGETLIFRFRLGTDGVGVLSDGWWIDDVQVAGCLADVILDNNFESP